MIDAITDISEKGWIFSQEQCREGLAHSIEYAVVGAVPKQSGDEQVCNHGCNIICRDGDEGETVECKKQHALTGAIAGDEGATDLVCAWIAVEVGKD